MSLIFLVKELKMLASKMALLITKLADGPPNYHQTDRICLQTFCTPSFDEYFDSERACNNFFHGNQYLDLQT